MSRKETREQLFKEKLARMKLEGEIRALQFSIKYKELTQKMEQVECSINLARTKIDN
ncbi:MULTISPECIES: hypothetical protein [Bacillus cereus group]|uniref:hypothetical protein n=1 Tax=Bacillus cereus group TaxID=86661 RepID=UPI000A6E6D9A|nr:MULTISPECIES: hypothetical protein [Bacillus cereus group]MDA1779928.1 hypothetical protein [Bacillus cereus group sp. BY9-3LC]MED1444152.1 hypothetical protein [Bacillus pacificus]